MTQAELKRVMRLLKEIYAEAEKESLTHGLDSEEFKALQEKLRETALSKLGFTVEEYREAKAELEKVKTEKIEATKPQGPMQVEIKGVAEMKGDPGNDGHTPTDEELVALIKPLIPEPISGKTPTHEELLALIKPLIPKVKDGETPSDERLIALIKPLLPDVIGPVDAATGFLVGEIEKVRKEIPAPLKEEELIQKIEEISATSFKKNIDIMGMPDFRKVAMGLDSRISDIENNGAGGGASSFLELTDTPDDYTDDAQKFVKVNAAGDGLEFVAGSGVTAEWGDITGTLADQTDLQTELDAKQDVLTGLTASVDELNYTDGVTSAIQTQLDGKQPLDSDLTTIAGLADPNADRILFWDDSAGAYGYLTASTGLTISTTNMTVRTSSAIQTGIVELATDAETLTGTDTARATTPANIAAKLASPGTIGGTAPGAASFTNITVSGTVDGRDVAADGTKLDGIEALADVTDTTNVTAAGALMDSEVTNLAAVKAFDPTDYATSAQGTLADSAVQDLSDLGITADATELNYVDGVTSAIQTQLDAKANSSGALTQFVGNGNHKVFYSNGSGDITELTLGADGTFLKSNGATSAPTFATPAGSGDVSKVGTPVDGQLGVWTGDGTIEGDAALTFDTSTDTLSTVDLSLSNDLLLASASAINFASGDVTITHVAASGSLVINADVDNNAADTVISLGVDGNGEALLSSTAFYPGANDGNALGTTTNGWSDLFLAEGGVINWDSSDVTLTQTGNVLAVAGGDLRVATADVGTNADSVPTLSSTNTLTNKTLTSPAINTATLGGHQLMAEGAALQFDSALSADGTYNGWVRAGTAGATLAFGDLCYLDPTDSRWELVDANAAAGADGDARGVLGICVLAAASDGSATTMLLWGVVRADTAFPTFTVNNPVYISETAGDVTGTQPTTTDVVIRIVGVGLTGDELFFNPDQTWATHT